MNDAAARFAGGCLCGALRYEAEGEPLYAGLCYCTDCQKASGSGFIPFLGFAASAVRFSGESRASVCKTDSGSDATRNFCAACGSMVFGGERGKSDAFTIYAGSLDDVSLFHPKAAIFTRSRPAWAVIPPGLKIFEALPPPRPHKD
jgi:hypothetical protein